MERPKPRVLVVDDETNQRTALAAMIEVWGYEAGSAANGAEALDRVASFNPSVIVTDLMMPVMDGSELLRRLREQGSTTPVIVLTAFGNLETAIAVVHDLGAYWFLEKPLQPPALRLLLERAVRQRQLLDSKAALERRLGEEGVVGEMTGSSPAMRAVFTLLRQVAPTSATVLISGESGTGKELAARAVHTLSPRRDAPFVAINCAALPETLIESELFGHEKGAFTGAVERRRGCFELANLGTLLLDEIGEMPLSTQAKLLRVLEDRRVRRLGSPREVDVDVRVVAASNRNLQDEARAGRFREDLFFRLNVFHVEMPPLREHRDDIPALSDTLIAEMNRRHGCSVSGLSPEALELLHAHAWPGNVRELRNMLERAVILAGTGRIGPAHLAGLGPAPPRTRDEAGVLRLEVGSTIHDAERALIDLTLRHTGGNRTRAAALLGISQKTLFNKLRGSEE